ncbi:MAG: STAS-like domain-containing protein [Planctomycetaceae bacterium]
MAIENLELLISHARSLGAISTDEAMSLLGVSRATAQRRLRSLVADGRLVREGAGRGARYVLPTARWERPLDGLEEHKLWTEARRAVADFGLSERELGTAGYTFTEMVNNAIDHSRGNVVCVTAASSSAGVVIDIVDDGMGVFRSVRESQALTDDVEAVFVLEKGRFTTLPDRHTGEGIFFASKAANRYLLASGKVTWHIDNDTHDTAIQLEPEPRAGTRVVLTFVPGNVSVLADVFRQWTDPDTLAFDRTRTTVRLAGFGVQLLSRSEARRVTVGLEPFRHVTIDFTGVELVGQGFCDEVFRVFAEAHPQIVLAPTGMNESVAFMVERSRRRA